MRKKYKKLLILFIILFLGTSVAIPSLATNIEEAENKKVSLEEKKKETQAKINEIEKEKGNTKVYIEKLDVELNSLKKEIDRLGNEISEAESNLAIAKEELVIAQETEENQYKTMKKRMKYIYENGNSDYVELILKAESLSDLLNRTEYVEKISEYDNNMLVRYQEAKQAVIEKQAEIKAKLLELNDMIEKVEYEQETVSTLVAKKEKEIEKLNQDIKESEQLVNKYDSEIEAQENVIENLLEEARRKEEARRAEEARKEAARKEAERKAEEERKAEQNKGNPTSDPNNSDQVDEEPDNKPVSSGNFIWPVPSSGRITSYFGIREQPTAGASTNHKGIDIGAPTGTNIVAAASGSVIVAGYSSSAGNYIMISHGDGIYTVYMHCSKLLVSVGDYVNQGSIIGLVGSTGYSTGPHLHFGISVNGTYVNPLNYVSN